jgi:CRP/FNR family transcriptional regulator, cyclic AMP receptor protein
MSLVIDTLRISTIAKDLTNAETQVISELFEIQDYKAGQTIIHQGIAQPENLYILAQGEIQVSIQCSEGEDALHVLKPGDLAGIVTFVGDTSEHISATLTAIGDVKILSMTKAKFETLIDTHPRIVYKVMCGVVRDVHGIVRRMNTQTAEMSNYMFRIHGRY